MIDFKPRVELTLEVRRNHRNQFVKVIILLAYQSPLWFDERPVLSVHFVVETAGVAEVVPVAVSPPKRGGGGAAVHTLAAL